MVQRESGFRRRLRDLTADEMLSWAYMVMVENLDYKARRKLDLALLPEAAKILDDPDLPESLQGRRVPDWWLDDEGDASLP